MVGGTALLLAMTVVALELSSTCPTKLFTTLEKDRSVRQCVYKCISTVFMIRNYTYMYMYLFTAHKQLAGILEPYEGECLLDPPTAGQTTVEFTRWDEVVGISLSLSLSLSLSRTHAHTHTHTHTHTLSFFSLHWLACCVQCACTCMCPYSLLCTHVPPSILKNKQEEFRVKGCQTYMKLPTMQWRRHQSHFLH